MSVVVNYIRTRRAKSGKCLCGSKGCTCMPSPHDIKLRPGERVAFGSRTTVSDGIYEIWIRHKRKQIVFAHRPTKKAIRGFRNLLDALYRKTIHVPGQDDKTRLWAAEKLLDLPDLFRRLFP